MAWQQIGEGRLLEAGDIASLMDGVSAGERVRLAINLRTSPAQWVVDEIKSRMDDAGIPDAEVYSGSPVLNVIWRKSGVSGVGTEVGLDPVTLIIIAIILSLILAITIIGWLFFKEVAAKFPALVPILALTGLGIVVVSGIYFSRR